MICSHILILTYRQVVHMTVSVVLETTEVSQGVKTLWDTGEE